MRLGNEIEFGQENKSLGTLGTYASRRAETSDMTYNYFCYDIECDFFYRHIARTHLPISCKAGVNHWIPFAEAEVDAKDAYKSHFMVDFLRRVTPQTSPLRDGVVAKGDWGSTAGIIPAVRITPPAGFAAPTTPPFGISAMTSPFLTAMRINATISANKWDNRT